MKTLYLKTILLPVLLCACSGNPDLPWNRQEPEDESAISHDAIVLGEQLPDPYSVENITKAFESLYPTKAGRAHIEATDFYVRFLPKDESQLSTLLELGLQMLDHPLDYRIVKDGDWYHDPDVPEGEITWQYAVVPVDFEFPAGVRYERLEDCYLSEHDPATKSDGIDWDAVERESYILTGNEGLLAPAVRSGDNGPVCPDGYIQIMDPDFSADPVGVKGVRVCCNSFVKIAMSYTDENGHYKMNRSYSTKPRYRLVFKNVKGFAQGISNLLLPASISALGSHPASGCNIVIDNSSDYHQFVRCVVNNAGFDYYQACDKSAAAIPSPPKDLRIWDLPIFSGSFNIMMHHGVILETFEPLHAVLGEFTIVARLAQPDVYLGLEGCSSYNEAYEKGLKVFTQAGHFSRVGRDWWHEYVVSFLGSSLFQTFAELLGSVFGGSGGSQAKISHLYTNYCTTVLYRRHYNNSDGICGADDTYSPQLLVFLDERGLGLEMLAPLFNSEVKDMDTLKQKMLSYYPQFKTVILEAFTRYDN